MNSHSIAIAVVGQQDEIVNDGLTTDEWRKNVADAEEVIRNSTLTRAELASYLHYEFASWSDLTPADLEAMLAQL
jgi:hypothetical protein